MAMKGEVPEVVQNLIKTNVPYFDWDARAKDLFQEKMREELAKRFLYDRDVIMGELKALTQVWKPFDDTINKAFTRYRYSGKELYADAISVLFNNPQLLKTVAPNFYKGFFSYLESKPTVKAVWDDLQSIMVDPTQVFQHRFDRLNDMFERGGAAKKAVMKKAEGARIGFLDALKLGFYTKSIGIRGARAKMAGKGVITPQNDPVFKAEQVLYSDGPIHVELKKILHNVQIPLNKANIDPKILSQYLMMRRILGERGEDVMGIANPLGFTAEDARQYLSDLRQLLGDKKYEILDNTARAFDDARKPIRDLVKKYEPFDPETQTKILDNDVYAKFEVQKYIENRYGKGIGSKIYHQVGTLEEITDPLAATFETDISLAYSITRGAAIKSLEVFKDELPGMVQEADYKYDASLGKRVPAEPKDPAMELLTYSDKGKIKGLWVDKKIAVNFEMDPYASHNVIRAVGDIFKMISMPFKGLLVDKNPFWAIWNLQRDVRAMAKAVPEANLIKAVQYSFQALPDAWKEVVQQLPTEVVEEMYEKFELIPDKYFGSRSMTVEEKLEQQLAEMTKAPDKLHEHLSRLSKVWKVLDKVIQGFGIPGALSEKMVKIGGHRMLKDLGAYSGEEAAHIVRSRLGSPNFRDAGLLSDIYNNIVLYSNAGIRGMDASWESAKGGWEKWDKKARNAYAWKTMKYDILPKILMYGAGLGLLGPYMKKLYDGIPDKDKQNYACIPLGFTQNGKTVYIPIPSDFAGQLIGGILWRVLKFRNPKDISSIMDYTMGSIPYTGFNPVIGFGYDLSQYVTDKTVYDSWADRELFTKNEKDAGIKYTLPKFAKHEWNKLGGGMLYRFPSSDRPHVLSDLEKITKVPFAGPLMSRVVRISNRGIMDSINEAIKDSGVRKQRAAENIEAEDAIFTAFTRGENPDPVKIYGTLVQEGKIRTGHPTYSDFLEKYKRVGLMQQDEQFMNAYLNAESKEEKAVIIIDWLTKKGTKEKSSK
jgi:hypothetical protein